MIWARAQADGVLGRGRLGQGGQALLGTVEDVAGAAEDEVGIVQPALDRRRVRFRRPWCGGVVLRADLPSDRAKDLVCTSLRGGFSVGCGAELPGERAKTLVCAGLWGGLGVGGSADLPSKCAKTVICTGLWGGFGIGLGADLPGKRTEDLTGFGRHFGHGRRQFTTERCGNPFRAFGEERNVPIGNLSCSGAGRLGEVAERYGAVVLQCLFEHREQGGELLQPGTSEIRQQTERGGGEHDDVGRPRFRRWRGGARQRQCHQTRKGSEGEALDRWHNRHRSLLLKPRGCQQDPN